MTLDIDLNIENEIVPLFDFTNNDYSKSVILDIFNNKLSSIDEVYSRQKILEAFITYSKILNKYNYSRVEFLEVYDFLSNYGKYNFTGRKYLFFRITNKKTDHFIIGKHSQLVLFFNFLYRSFISRLEAHSFPEIYRNDLRLIQDFLFALNLEYYEDLVQNENFTIKKALGLVNILTRKIQDGSLKDFWQRLFTFEAFVSISIGHIKKNLQFPKFTTNGINLIGLFHPLLENPVKTDLIADKNVLLLTGPNMSGKSTFLRSVGLSVFLGHLGLGVPAEEAKFPFFDEIFVFLSHNDDLKGGYSRFMLELDKLKRTVTAAQREQTRCFAIFDELFIGTNFEEAFDLTLETIRGLLPLVNSYFFISTHFQKIWDIEEIKNEEVSTFYFDCILQEERVLFTYKLTKGWTDQKIGKKLFNLVGLDKLFVKR